MEWKLCINCAVAGNSQRKFRNKGFMNSTKQLANKNKPTPSRFPFLLYQPIDFAPNKHHHHHNHKYRAQYSTSIIQSYAPSVAEDGEARRNLWWRHSSSQFLVTLLAAISDN
jgi:hypothetical protein